VVASQSICFISDLYVMVTDKRINQETGRSRSRVVIFNCKRLTESDMKERYLPSDDMKERYSVFISNCGHIHLIIFAGKSHSDQRWKKQFDVLKTIYCNLTCARGFWIQLVCRIFSFRFAEMLQAGTMPSMNERIKDWAVLQWHVKNYPQSYKILQL